MDEFIHFYYSFAEPAIKSNRVVKVTMVKRGALLKQYMAIAIGAMEANESKKLFPVPFPSKGLAGIGEVCHPYPPGLVYGRPLFLWINCVIFF